MLREAESLRVDCENRTIFLLDGHKQTLEVKSFDAKIFKDTCCTRRNNALVYSRMKCPVLCFSMKAKMLESSTINLDREFVENNFLTVVKSLNLFFLFSNCRSIL